MQLHEMNLWQVMIFRLYFLYNKHKMIKIGTQNREISQVLSQVLEYFFCRLYMIAKIAESKIAVRKILTCVHIFSTKIFFKKYDFYIHFSAFRYNYHYYSKNILQILSMLCL